MKKNKVIAVSIIIVLCIFCTAALMVYSGIFAITSAQRLNNEYAEVIAAPGSAKDMDHDGIDDASDILQGAVAYTETHPKYKSRYYAGGYPDDGYGTCTDVVANGLKAVGYDLMALVQADIKAHPENYEIDVPDANIDFRRVRNLNVYFKDTAVSLTTDTAQKKEWQGGDIVVFQNHIGIVSDRRNKDGIPYVIHHTSPFQLRYEEDILAARTDIIGHYRVG
jgi:uncharacterized protein YijF (DUF1287 family)